MMESQAQSAIAERRTSKEREGCQSATDIDCNESSLIGRYEGAHDDNEDRFVGGSTTWTADYEGERYYCLRRSHSEHSLLPDEDYTVFDEEVCTRSLRSR